jgi:hypothetical protein
MRRELRQNRTRARHHQGGVRRSGDSERKRACGRRWGEHGQLEAGGRHAFLLPPRCYQLPPRRRRLAVAAAVSGLGGRRRLHCAKLSAAHDLL